MDLTPEVKQFFYDLETARDRKQKDIVDDIIKGHAATYKKFYDDNTRTYSVGVTGEDVTTTSGMKRLQKVYKHADGSYEAVKIAKEEGIKTWVKGSLHWVALALVAAYSVWKEKL